MNKNNTKYMPQLDALRAFAVLVVILEHWPSSRESFIVELNPGFLGVNFFFVLSGFLISQILLRNKNDIINKKNTKSFILKQFIVIRALRIFPIYYLTIFTFYVLDLSGIREKFGWYVFYGSNFYLNKIQSWDGPLTHFWTLAIEEQFYLFWPLIILLIPKKHITTLLLSLSILPAIFRLLFTLFAVQNGDKAIFIEILTPSCLDSFAVGALLAHHRVNQIKIPSFFLKWSKLLYIFLPVYFLSLIFSPRDSLINIVFLRIFISLFSIIVIAKASIGYNHSFPRYLLENGILRYLGKISYGLYLYHNIVPYIYLVLVNQTTRFENTLRNIHLNPLPVIENEVTKFIVFFIILIGVSSLSWYLIEKPINSLKKYFNY